MNKWTDAQLLDARALSWDEFSVKYENITKEAWRKKKRLPAPEPRPESTELPPYEIRNDGEVFINRASRTVVTDLGPYGSVTFSFEKHAAMRRRYSESWEDDADTIPAIARDFDMPPKAFERYKRIHAWTHESDPFTDEEWQEGLTVEEAVAQTIESQRRAFHKKLQKETWAHVIRDADKWRRFEELAQEPIIEAIAAYSRSYQPPKISIKPAMRPYDLVFVPTDFHYGKLGWEDDQGKRYTRARAKELLLSRTTKIIEYVTAYGRPERIITAVGSDYFHIDAYAGTTTSGTPQDLDGDPHQVVWEGIELALTQMDMLRAVAPLDIFYLAGNHDRMMGYALLAAVKAWFRNDGDVTISSGPRPRQYIRRGKTLLGFAHGDEVKQKDLPLLMATEASEHWGHSNHRAWFTGHLHYEHVQDINGVVLYQMPSLSGDDRWHVQKGYVGSRKGLAAYLVDHNDGVFATLSAPVEL